MEKPESLLMVRGKMVSSTCWRSLFHHFDPQLSTHSGEIMSWTWIMLCYWQIPRVLLKYLNVGTNHAKQGKTEQNRASALAARPTHPASRPGTGRPACLWLRHVSASTCMCTNAMSTQLRGAPPHMQRVSNGEPCHFINPTLGSVKSSIQGTSIQWLRKKHKEDPMASKEAQV